LPLADAVFSLALAFRWPNGELHPTGQMLSQFTLDVLVNGVSIAYSKPLQAVVLQEVTFMSEYDCDAAREKQQQLLQQPLKSLRSTRYCCCISLPLNIADV
jgi:hypothetical protein